MIKYKKLKFKFLVIICAKVGKNDEYSEGVYPTTYECLNYSQKIFLYNIMDFFFLICLPPGFLPVLGPT